VKGRQFFLLATLLLALFSTGAQADLAETKEDIKQGTKDAAKKTGHAVREGAHATGRAAKSFGHAVADGARATKHAVKRVFHKDDSSD
jgi:hypothetical protein